MHVSYALNPYRYSDDPLCMRGFLEDLGMRTLLSSGSGYALLRAGAGLVAVHPVRDGDEVPLPGDTHLAFEVDSAESAARALRAAGMDAIVWDEAYGRHAGVAEPCGGGIWINEEMRDLHGYEAHDASGADTRLTVTAVRVSDDFARDARFFAAFGFHPEGEGSEWWQALRASAGSGIIGLHAPDGAIVTRPSAGNPITGRDPLVRLGFQTSEPLDLLAERMLAAGHGARLVMEPAPSLCVMDPDGQRIEVHPAG